MKIWDQDPEQVVDRYFPLAVEDDRDLIISDLETGRLELWKILPDKGYLLMGVFEDENFDRELKIECMEGKWVFTRELLDVLVNVAEHMRCWIITCRTRKPGVCRMLERLGFVCDGFDGDYNLFFKAI